MARLLEKRKMGKDLFWVDDVTTDEPTVIPAPACDKFVNANFWGPFFSKRDAWKWANELKRKRRVRVVEKPYWDSRYGGVWAQVFIDDDLFAELKAEKSMPTGEWKEPMVTFSTLIHQNCDDLEVRLDAEQRAIDLGKQLLRDLGLRK